MKRRRRLALTAAAGVTLAEAALVARRRGSLLAVETVVRCRDGHLFTTLWLPGASLKALRLGPWRFQRCPVGRHWTLVAPVDAARLTDEERRLAAERHDVPVP